MKLTQKIIENQKVHQKIVDEYENCIWNFKEAIRFVKGGCGKPHAGVFNILDPLIKRHEENMYKNMEEIIKE